MDREGRGWTEKVDGQLDGRTRRRTNREMDRERRTDGQQGDGQIEIESTGQKKRQSDKHGGGALQNVYSTPCTRTDQVTIHKKDMNVNVKRRVHYVIIISTRRKDIHNTKQHIVTSQHMYRKLFYTGSDNHRCHNIT